jgi:hypothetical protein
MMDDRDEPCLICGLRPGEGPKILYREMDDCLDTLIGRLSGLGHEIDDATLRGEMEKLLLLFKWSPDLYPNEVPFAMLRKNDPISLSYFPLDDGDGRAIVIGTFNELGDPINSQKGDITIPPRGYVSRCRCSALSHNLIVR